VNYSFSSYVHFVPYAECFPLYFTLAFKGLVTFSRAVTDTRTHTHTHTHTHTQEPRPHMGEVNNWRVTLKPIP